MREEELELSLKVVIVGNGAVGKSSMIQRFCKGTYTRDYKKTIGVDFLEREIEIDGEDVRLMLWDTAGQEEFDAITAAYYRGAHACVLAYSATDRNSFDAIPSWKLKVHINIHISTSTSTHSHPHIHIHTSTSLHPHPHIHIHTSTSTHPDPYIHILTSTSVQNEYGIKRQIIRCKTKASLLKR
ncbi:PREDICTED: ras-related protein Rab-23-like [Polistes dominula]|uniref:Ras-related protein Rab-23-like n=1 Tax=Polistes dominula TaxID=743375 RepID=A0ABM1IAG5_POLDO|nr:PREDICTED: ras-related protein Rab-23-like [Polistes dominula]